ncbi:MAG: hypothetical protein JO112_06995 [Planctomycetes bacterium]|nr:hypothetical protein [Planctomycetota bacterium]
MGITCVKALISVPLPEVWDFIIRPENLHLWIPLKQPIPGIGRPWQAGDLVMERRKLGRLNRLLRRLLRLPAEDQVTQGLVEEVIPYHSFRLRVLVPEGAKLTASATVYVEAAEGGKATWIEEVISYSFTRPVARRLDPWLINPLLGIMVRPMTKAAFCRLEAQLAQPHQQRDVFEGAHKG